MPRPVKWRKIEFVPTVQKFVPAEMPASPGENLLKLEELEAIRLKDLEGMDQADCAAQMEVSRPTFQRILLSARAKIADSLINGKTIKIQGGHYTTSICPIRCVNCGRVWHESLEHIVNATEEARCPRCRSGQLVCCPDDDSEAAATCRRHCKQRNAGLAREDDKLDTNS